jgi:hypothetical protein
MTSPQFTKDELRIIADALATHHSHLSKLFPMPVGDPRERLKEIARLKSKAIALLEAT